MTRAEILNQLYRKQSGWFPHVWTGNGSLRNIPVLQITAWVPLPLRNPPSWLPVLTPWPAVTTPNRNCRFPNETVSIWVQGLSCLLPYPSYLSQCTTPALFTRHTEPCCWLCMEPVVWDPHPLGPATVFVWSSTIPLMLIVMLCYLCLLCRCLSQSPKLRRNIIMQWESVWRFHYLTMASLLLIHRHVKLLLLDLVSSVGEEEYSQRDENSFSRFLQA